MRAARGPLGAGQFAAITTWLRGQAMAPIATVCIAARATFPWAIALKDALHLALARCKIRPIGMPELPISATEVRQRLSQGLGTGHLVNSGVARYIAHNSPYTDFT